MAKTKTSAKKKYRVKGIPGVSPLLTVKGAKQKAWNAIARYVRWKEPRCCTCGGLTTEAGHFLHNSDKTNQQLGGNELWYDIRNIHGQCGTCNRWKSGNGPVYSHFLIEKYGDGIIKTLYTLFRTPRKWTVLELLAIEKKYDDMLPGYPQKVIN